MNNILSNVRTDSKLDLILLLVNFWYELGKIIRYIFLDARFVIWHAIDLLLLLVNIWFWANNDQIWLLEARLIIFSNIRTDFNFIFGELPVTSCYFIILKSYVSGKMYNYIYVIDFIFSLFSEIPSVEILSSYM